MMKILHFLNSKKKNSKTISFDCLQIYESKIDSKLNCKTWNFFFEKEKFISRIKIKINSQS